QQVQPDAEGVETGDYINIEGIPNIQVAIKPEIPGGTATAALAVNMIPQVINAPAGLASMAELPVPSARLANFREFLK
ncbi:MAG: dihydrodipicolinate reductase, partial [Synergistaceae bacterium]|nr:dihydrodipicolinate reductase [Synergistaceae bacterium]